MTVDAFAFKQASLQARLLVGTGAFRPDDLEDIRQDLLFDNHRRTPKFDKSRGEWHGFVQGTMRNHATVLIARRRRRTNNEVLAADLVEANADIVNDPMETLPRYDPVHGLIVSLDVQRLLKDLSADHRSLAGLLGERRVTEICAEIGKSRSRVYQMIREIRTAFIEAGLGPPAGGHG